MRSCLLESESMEWWFFLEYAFQRQITNLLWFLDKWKVWKMTILFCVSHHHILNSKSNVFIEFLFPRLLGSRHVSIKVLVFWFSWKTSQNWLLQVFRKVQKFCQNFWISDNAWILALKNIFIQCPSSQRQNIFFGFFSVEVVLRVMNANQASPRSKMGRSLQW